MWRALGVASVALGLLAQQPGGGGGGVYPGADEPRVPSMKREQIEKILEADRKQSIEDAGKLVTLAEELKTELEKSDKHVLSITAMKRAEEIEKLAKRIKGRMKRL